ncbi:schlafen family member 13-like [Talpa occidentalis]|uniref:schlafen family member 13-like n=1 Tax=Talpa occidentalis TaxID=50954 RepID=UPI00188E06B9|nr:schlafen family member 13-like [Talpa occidentalis]XP_037349966.1 schlafen family member 13-like [Talpa occidentalis]
MNHYLLEVEPFYPDLVINVGKVTIGELNRKQLQKNQRTQEKDKVKQAACALLNSGGGVILVKMANEKNQSEMGLDLEQALRDLIQSPELHAFFETVQQKSCFYIFVKSWTSDTSSTLKPPICSLSSSLYCRSGTSTLCMDSRQAFNFLKTKKMNVERSPINEGFPPTNIPRNEHLISVFQRNRFEFGEVLPFPESELAEFKQFSTKRIQEYLKEIIPGYVSAFANSRGGYLFVGVEDKSRKVQGCAKENVDLNSLEYKIENVISKLHTFHFCSLRLLGHPPINHQFFEKKIAEVHKDGNLYGYLCMIKVKPFCCVVFSEAPSSWVVKEKQVCCLTTEEWVDKMVDTGPDLAEDFNNQLDLSQKPPSCRPVYSRKGLDHKKALQKALFPVSSGPLQYTPKSLWKELCSEHKGLKELINMEMQPICQGILILSRSWAVDLSLPEEQGVICDALLIAQNSYPILYTILGEKGKEMQFDRTHTAFTLKQKLVNKGGYPRKLCIMTKTFYLGSEGNAELLAGSNSSIDYPESYKLADDQQMEDLLQSLVIVLLGFRSFLSDELGCEVLNLLTHQQYEILSKNLYKTRELFVHGLPGSGKTIMAIKIMKKIRNVFHCETKNILYICENQPLRDFISHKNICEAVTRKTFMKYDFKDIQHIIIDEAQNFRTEDGEWYDKAKNITWRKRDDPGILWIFLDYFQTTHMYYSGLPAPSDQNSREKLYTVVRNADPIANYLQEKIEEVKKNPPPSIPSGSLAMLGEAIWAQGVSGKIKFRNFMSLEQVVTCVAEKCRVFFKNGYSPKHIAVLLSKSEVVDEYKEKLRRAMRRRSSSQMDEESNVLVQIKDALHVTDNCIVLDSIRRFSGLERTIVFGINPQPNERAVTNNLLLCLASRAKKHLYILTNRQRPQSKKP